MTTYAISSGVACFAEAGSERVSARRGDKDWIGTQTLVHPFLIKAGRFMVIKARSNVYVFDVLLHALNLRWDSRYEFQSDS